MRYFDPKIPGDAERAMSETEASLRRRAEFACREAVGKTFRVRTSPNGYVEGVIVEAAVDDVLWGASAADAAEFGGNRARAVVRVVMECGVARERRTFRVSRLPR